MLRLLIYLLFILSVAFASAGIVLSSRLRNRYRSDFLSSLLYFQVFIFTFGFYGIWGQLVIKTFLADYVSAETLTRITDISILLGLPFLVFSWLMLIRLALEISGRKPGNWLIVWFLIINFLIILSIGYLISSRSDIKPTLLIRYYFIILNFLYTIIASIIILIHGRKRSFLLKIESQLAASVIIFLMVSQSIALYFYKSEVAAGLIFVFIFFAGNTFFPVYFSYSVKIHDKPEEPAKDISFGEFCKKFEVSPRESDIIREICNGLSNKEISDKLFISLQTVKDHTHRIYIKTNVRSRAQLMRMVKEGEKSRRGEGEMGRGGDVNP
jgi:DNA-binding CsgD family transcriptional regulator